MKCSTARRVCWGGSLRVGRCRSLCSLAHSPQIPLDSAVTAWSAVHPFDPGFVRAALGARRPPALWPQPPRAARAAFPGPGPSRSHGLDTCISARAWRPGSGPCHGGRFLWAQAGFGHRSAVCPEVRAIQPCMHLSLLEKPVGVPVAHLEVRGTFSGLGIIATFRHPRPPEAPQRPPRRGPWPLPPPPARASSRGP